jgi:peptidoglycan/LPS O-acetylase OafA/YrhL
MSHEKTRTAHDSYLERSYFPELDGLRAISVLLVISVHLYDAKERWMWLAGYRGVTIFFVLSGYLITTLALREEARYGRLSLAAFYVRRSFRIFPLYYFTLAVYCLLILGLGISANLRDPLKDALPYYLLYWQEVPFCLWQVLTTRDLVFIQSWTLGAEEKFYLLWPLLAFVLWRGNGRRRLLGTASLAVGLAVVPAILTPFGPVPRVIGRMLFCYCSLLTGCLLAFLLHDRVWFYRLRRLGGAAITAALLLLLAAHFATPLVSNPSLADGVNVLYTLAVGLFLACLLVDDGPLQRLLRWRPLVGIGRLSYGMYLLHMLAMAAVYRLLPASRLGVAGSILVYFLTSVLSMALAWLMYCTLESFGINLGRRWSRRIIERAAARSSLQARVDSGQRRLLTPPASSSPWTWVGVSSDGVAKNTAPDAGGSCLPAPS